MSVIQATLLGIVEGITEFLPISSTGHLLLIQRIFGMGTGEAGKAASNAYAICIQLGAILAVLLVCRRRIARLIQGLAGRDSEGLRLAGLLLAAFLPAAVLGWLLEPVLKEALFGLWPVAIAWVAGGAFILLFTRRDKAAEPARGLEALDLRSALIVGTAQCLALWPGVSRSLATIAAALLLGFSAPAAVEMSFLLGLLTLGAATLYEALSLGPLILSAYGWLSPLAGMLAAAACAFASATWMVSYLNRRGLGIFGYYRLGIGLVAIVLLAAGLI